MLMHATSIADPEQLRASAERIRASGVLGRSPLMQKLFDFLVECSLAGRAPKEIEVAVDALGRGPDFDVTQDAMVRVYIHKLRRKLEEYYAGPGAHETLRLSMPKGEYRFALEPVAAVEPTAAAEPPAAAPPAPRRKWLVVALAASVLVNLGVVALLLLRSGEPPDEFREVRASPVWSKLLNDDRSIFIVVGDYYIFGETDESSEVKRLVREFEVNSPQDLERYLKRYPEAAGRYLDLELAYLPTSSAFALRNLMPVLATANKRVRIVTTSELNPGILKSAHIIYVGYLSGLGMLGDLVFAGSRFSVGDTFDELVDRDTKKRYISQAAMPPRDDTKYHDYGYFATFAGPSGNQIMVIAGTRDLALMQTAEALTSGKSLAALARSAGDAAEFEALYEVYGMDRLNLDGKLLLTSRVDSSNIWMSDAR
jgi:hypothetical protein